MALATAALILPAGARGGKRSAAGPAPGRADVITIEVIKAFGALERTPVVFMHDKHTKALAKKGKDCSVCHAGKGQELVLKFNREKDQSRAQVMDAFHDGCIGCHQKTAQAGAKSGPVTCGQCHQEKPWILRDRADLSFDKSLHYRHLRAADNKCDACHHQYDQKAKKLVYAKGKESACRYCHLDQPRDKVSSLKTASHEQCIACHRQKAAKKIEGGPIDCAGCHSPISQLTIKKVMNPPRIQRGQPDAAFVSSGGKGLKFRMAAVPFDHLGHEAAVANCYSCHHKALDKCSKCHTVEGSKEGGFVSLETAMHQRQNSVSCVACHNKKQDDPNCSGCHSSIAKDRVSDKACKVCHLKGAKPSGRAEADRALAAELLGQRREAQKAYPMADIPETVTIGRISKQFGPVKLPHRRIITKMLKGVKDSRLARAFHTDPGTFCQGCHHNSPPAVKPPGCGNCHGRPFQEQSPAMPGLKAAYHQQCMGCHQRMKIAKPADTACTECHKEKK